MADAQTIAQWQQFLQTLAPVEGWLYVGAGRGDVLRETRFARVPRLLAVEAEQHASQLLTHIVTTQLNKKSNWNAAHALVDNIDSEATWHQLSREEESGLLPAEALISLWPNLNEYQRSEQPTASLRGLLEPAGTKQKHYNWLTIDCLPAARLLQGLNDALEPLDMIEVRVTVSGSIPRQAGATLEECDELLLPQGFTRLTLEKANNPLIGKALYGRDFKLQLTEAMKVYTELERQNDSLTSQCHELKTKNEAIDKEREDLRSELNNQRGRELQLQEELQHTWQSVNELQSQNETLTSQYDELKAKNENIEAERRGISNELSDQRDRESKLQEKLQHALQTVAELESQNDTLTSQRNELEATNEAIQKEREGTHSKLNNLDDELKNQKGLEDEVKEKLQQAQSELKDQQRSAQLSTKLLTKVEADASELRQRYAEKVKSEQELKDLIKELHAKLHAASHFYHKLEQEHPELLKKL